MLSMVPARPLPAALCSLDQDLRESGAVEAVRYSRIAQMLPTLPIYRHVVHQIARR
jgi:hypothetical protein